MQIPSVVSYVLTQLERAGYEAYIVGGCVRDTLLQLTPHDWDICTVATPEEIMCVFEHETILPTGIQHGTVTLVCDQIPIEITTYRIESDYRDNRHPDNVCFVRSILEDLKRRDFTVNAMAYHPDRGLLDPFDGLHDLNNRCLRCVGEPTTRFSEDALRILRALRFSAVYGFRIEEKTGNALLCTAPTLAEISPERIQSELSRMLVGTYLKQVLTRYYPILFAVIPELRATEGFEQYSRYHCFDVLHHILEAVCASHADLTVRLAALLHDIGKPLCFSQDEKGNGHFYSHASLGETMADTILRRLRFDHQTINNVCQLIRHHDTPIERRDAIVKRWLNKLGPDQLNRLLMLKEADSRAHTPSLIGNRFEELRDIRERMERLLAEKACFSLHSLAIKGKDLIAIGIPEGKAIGECLQWLLNAVMDGTLPNDADVLLATARKRLDYFTKNR